MVLPARAGAVVHERQALGAEVHLAHPIGTQYLVQCLVEQTRAVFGARDVDLRRESEFERKPAEQAGTDAVHGADEGLRHLRRKQGPPAADQSRPHPVLKFRRCLDRERRADHGRGHHPALAKRLFQFPGQAVRLAAAGSGADEAYVFEVPLLAAHAVFSHRSRPQFRTLTPCSPTDRTRRSDCSACAPRRWPFIGNSPTRSGA